MVKKTYTEGLGLAVLISRFAKQHLEIGKEQRQQEQTRD